MPVHEIVKLPVNLTLAGPILTAGSTFSRWGLDSVFYRDWRQNYALPGSLVRGKLREAMRTLISLTSSSLLTVEQWFGSASGERQNLAESYAPRRGLLKVSDFIFTHRTSSPLYNNCIRTRIRIEPERLVVEPGALLALESPFAPGGHYQWEGSIEFLIDSERRDACLEQIKQAFHFITAIGANKTIGFGRLMKVAFGEPKVVKLSPRADEQETQVPLGLNLALKPKEPLMIGGIRRKENIFESEKIIPGAVLKGALAVGLNRIAGNADLNRIIDGKNDPVVELFSCLAKHFAGLRFLHAIPSENKSDRKETIPLSMASYDGKCEDVAFKTSEEDIWAKGTTPVSFRVDWKDLPNNLPDRYKFPNIEYHQVTRTAIDNDLLKADEGQLYSFRMIKPNEGISWLTQVQFPETASQEEKQTLSAELRQALPLALRYIGKRQSLVSLSVAPYYNQKMTFSAQNGVSFAITLQTPAIMVDPNEMAKTSQTIFDDRKILNTLYADYWGELLGSCAVLERIFASQELQGGYLGMRFMKNAYRPFYLTSAGSTFVFSVRDKEVWKKVDLLCKNGLPLPDWAKKTYAEPIWKNCPFIPQNGYGEILVR